MRNNNVLRDAPLTHNLLRKMVAGVVRSIQAREEQSDGEMGDVLGVSASTVANARNERNDLSALTLIQVGRRYRMDDLQPLAALVGAKLVPLDAAAKPDLSLPCIVNRFSLELSIALEDGKLDGSELVKMRPQLDALGNVIDNLRERLSVRAAS